MTILFEGGVEQLCTHAWGFDKIYAVQKGRGSKNLIFLYVICE